MSDIVQTQSEGKTLEQKAGEYVEAENERYKKANCGGMSAEACSMVRNLKSRFKNFMTINFVTRNAMMA